MNGIQLSIRFSETASKWLHNKAYERLVGLSESKRLQMHRGIMRDIVYELVEQAADTNADISSLTAAQKQEVEHMIKHAIESQRYERAELCGDEATGLLYDTTTGKTMIDGKSIEEWARTVQSS